MGAKDQKVKKLKQVHQFVTNTITNIEIDLKRIKSILHKLEKIDEEDSTRDASLQDIEKAINPEGLKSYSDEESEIVEGHFDGYFMLASDQKKYPVPLNYASKTKLVPGDKLKLRIKNDGKLIYKLILPAERKHQKATLSLSDDNKPIAITDDGKTYFLNHAAVTYFKGKAGDELYIVTNQNEEGGFAAIEAIIKQ